MSEPYPEYPRDSAGFIPLPQAYDYLLVFADYELSYLWDMNGVCIRVKDVTGLPEALDQEFETWARIYDNEFPDHTPFEQDESRKAQFDSEGLALAHKLCQRFNGSRHVAYISLDGRRTDIPQRPA